MGGKVKQSQRTKNNVRPSSSGRSAELLSSGGLGPAPALATGLASAVTGKPLPALFPTLAAASTDHYLNTDFMLCIKKLNKKDPITKTKALQELTELVNKNTSEEAVALLPFWTRLYRTLSTDPDHKVREVTQVCHGAIAARCGRALGGSLRALLPPWLHAQHDTAPAAAAAAELALRNTFPEKKLPEVISFCKAEVVAYLLENLIGNTEASLQNKGDSAEQVAVHYERIVIASLQGLQVLSLRLPRAHDAWLWAELRPLLDAGKFWKLPAGNSAQIRASFFSALGCILERFPSEFGAGHGKKTLRLLLQASRERAPWTCLLQLMHHAENWQQWLDDKNLLTKRIFEILENGGWGDAKNLSTMILPLLANLPADLRTQQFYEKFFNALFTGLSKKAIFSSKSERQSWITSIAECLRYVSIQDESFSLEVTTSVHRTWLEKILSTANDTQLRSHLIKYSVASMVSIIKYWLKQSKEDGGEKYDQLVRNFWQNVGSTVLGQIDKLSTDHEEIGHLIEGHILLMQALKTSFVQEPKKKQSIKFDIDTTDGTKEEETTEVCDISSLERYSHNLNETAYRICANYLEFAETKQVSEAVVTPLLTLIREFDSKQLFLAVARHFSASEEASVFGLYDGKLRVWLSGDTMRCTAVVDVVFVLLKHLSEDEQDRLLASFKQFPPSVVESCVSICVSHPHNTLPSVKRFLHSRLAEESLVAATRRLLAGDTRARGLLLAALHAGDDSQMLISASAISSILSLFTSTLDPSLPTLQQCASVASLVLSAVLADATGVEYRPLMCKLFYLNLAIKLGDGRLGADSWREARAAWLDGLAALSPAEAEGFVEEARGIVHRCRADLKKKLNLLKIEHMASLCPHLIRNLEDLDPKKNIEQIATFTKQLFEFPPEPQHTPVEFYALRLDCIKGNLQCPFDDDNDIIKKVIDESSQNTTEELTKEVLLSHVNKVLFRAFYLKTLMLRKVGGEDHDDDDDEETGGEVWCDALLDDEYMSQQFATLLYDRAVLEALKEGYAFWPDYETITSALSRLNLLIDDIITATSVDARQRQWRRLRATAAADGYYWAYAARYYSVKCSIEEETQESDNLENTVEGLSGNGFFHSLQAATKSLPTDDDDSILRAKFLLMVRAIFLAHAHDAAVLDATWMSELARCRSEIEDNQPGGGLDVVVNLYYRHNGVMLYETPLHLAPWRQVLSNSAIVDYLTELVSRRGWGLPAPHWDFATITLCSVVNSVEKSKELWGSPKVSLLTTSILRLYTTISSFITAVPATSLQRQPSAHVAHLPSEWADIFAPDVTVNLYSLLTHVLDSAPTTPITSTHIPPLSLLSLSPPPHASLPAPYRAGVYALRPLVEKCTRVLEAPTHHAYKYAAYYVLRMLEKPLVLDDADRLLQWSSSDSAEASPSHSPAPPAAPRPEFNPTLLLDAMTRLQGLVDAALGAVKVGEESCVVVPWSDSYSLCLGALLLGQLAGRGAALARDDLVHQYISIYRDNKFAEMALSNSMRLLPEAALARDAARDPARDALPADVLQMFLTEHECRFEEPPSPSHLSSLSCRVFYLAFSGLTSGAARGWAGGLPGRAAPALARLVRLAVTPSVVKKQLMNVQKHADSLDETEISILWSSNEVLVRHLLDERPVELAVRLARDHPLSPPQLTTSGGPAHNTQWVTVYLAYQNGRVFDAIRMWTEALERKVSAAPVCYICYCRLHPACGQLPRLTCHQCNNKFHTDCIHKWFASSHKSNCPLCRSTF